MIAKQIKFFFEKRGFVLGGDINRNDRIGALHKSWGHVFTNHLRGDYVEFGVYQGGSFIESYKQYELFNRWLQKQLTSQEEWRRKVAGQYIDERTHFHGLDTFAGMPPNSEGNITFAQGTYLSSYSEVMQRCLRAGMQPENFSLYRGLFSETTSELVKRLSPKIVIANIDCDIYEAAVDALQAISERLQLGCVLMFDDFNAYSADNNKGERRAFREFCDTVTFRFEPWFTYQYSGQAFLCVEE